METNPVSQVPINGLNRGEIVDLKDVIQYFGSFKLGDSQQDSANNSSDAKNIKKQRDAVQQTSRDSLCKSEKSSLDHGGRMLFVTREQDLWNNWREGSFSALTANRDRNADVFIPDIVGVEGLRKQCGCLSTMSKAQDNNVGIYPSTYNYENPIVRAAPLDILGVIPNNGLYHGPTWMDLQGVETPAMGVPSFDLSSLQEILDGGDRTEISMLIAIFQGSYLDLMTNRTLSYAFQKLVDYCSLDQMESVLAEVLSCTQLFTAAAFSRYGVRSIIKLIKRVKKSSHAYSIAQALSTQFIPIMTDETARMAIQHCFSYFPSHLNVDLYEKAILGLKELATDKLGCVSLNRLIHTIGGEQRSRLLNAIVDWSYYLSNDPYGNYVVQTLLSLKEEGVSRGIVLKLRGKCVELGKQEGGSHVVEKCIEASVFGAVCVVQEIVETPGASLELAQDRVGNYVIQTALRKTKECGFIDLRRSLVKSLEAHCSQLSLSTGGKMVLGLLGDDVGLKWRNRQHDAAWQLVLGADQDRMV